MDFSDIKHLASDDTQVIHDRVIETSSGLARNKLLGVFLFLIRCIGLHPIYQTLSAQVVTTLRILGLSLPVLFS